MWRLIPLPVVFALLTQTPAAASTAVLRGAVRTSDGAPLAGARAELLPLPSNDRWVRMVLESGQVAPEPVAASKADAAGRFSLEPPAAGLWQVVVRAEGHVPMRLAPVPGVNASELPPVVLPPDDGARVEVREASGEPAAGIWVYAVSAASSPGRVARGGWRPAARAGRTGDDGRLALPRAADEVLALSAFRSGGALFGTAEARGRTTLTLEPPAVRRVIEVRGEDGEPLADVAVATGELAWPAGTTAADGRLSLRTASREKLWLHLFARDGRRLRLQLAPAGEEEGPLRLVLPGRVPLAGQVVDAAGERPLAGALAWTGHDPGAFSVTDEQGRYDLTAPADERYWVQAAAGGFLPALAWIEGGEGAAGAAQEGVRIVLRRARSAFGRVIDSRDAPVPGAEVSVRAAAERGARRDEPLKGRSDAEGRFELPGLPAARVDLAVRAEGFAPLTARGVAIPEGDGPVDLGTLVLEAGAGLEGVVRDPNGEPIPGAQVWLAEDRGRPPEVVEHRVKDAEPAASTDGGGGFRIADLPPRRRWLLFFDHPRFVPASLAGVGTPAAEPLEVVLRPAAAVSGQVVDETGEGVAEARVSLSPEAPPPGQIVPRQREEQAATVFSDPAGRFAFHQVAPGAVEVEAFARGFLPAPALRVEVPEAGSVEDLRFVLERGSVVEGRVANRDGEPVAGARIRGGPASAVSGIGGDYRLEGVPAAPLLLEARHREYNPQALEIDIVAGVNHADFILQGGWPVRGRVIEEAGTPVAGAEVRLTALAARRDREQRTATGADGTFGFPRVADGQYALEAAKEGYAPSRLEEVVEVAGEAVAGLEVRLRPGATVSGHVLGLSFEELARVAVRAESDEDASRTGSVDYDGAYRIADLAPGAWLVRAWIPGHSRQAEARVVIPSAGGEVRRDLQFGRGLSLFGRASFRGEPLGGALVSLRGYDVAAERTASTDVHGRYRLDDLEPGSYRFSLSHPGELLLHNEDVELTSDLRLDVELAAAAVSGVVVSAAASEPLADATVSMLQMLSPDGARTGSLVSLPTDGSGAFLVARLTAGRYRLRAEKAGFEPAERILELAAGDEIHDLVLALSPAAGLELAVRLASGEVPSHVTVGVFDPSGNLLLAETARPAEDGRAGFSTVPAGTWSLMVTAPGEAAAWVTATVPGAPVEVVLPPATLLRVRVPALRESNLVASLTLLARDGQLFQTLETSGELLREWRLVGGSGSLAGVPPGVWTLRVVASDGRRWESVLVTAGEPEVAVDLE